MPRSRPVFRLLACALPVFVLVLMPMWRAGAAAQPAVAAPPGDREIVVSAAASLSNAFAQIGKDFEQARPGTRVVFNFGASGALLAQLRQGAPVDVFASADQATMDRAAQAGLLAPGTRVDFARNALVLIVPASAPTGPGSLAELAASPAQRIAVGTPSSVPAGAYARDAIAAAGLTGAFAPRLVFGENVRQVLSYVERGEVDAGFVYRSDALLAPTRVRIAFTVPSATVSYPIAVSAGRRSDALARDFIAQVRGPAGAATLARFGLDRP